MDSKPFFFIQRFFSFAIFLSQRFHDISAYIIFYNIINKPINHNMPFKHEE